LQDIDLSPEMVMALRDGRLMMEDEIIKEGDRIKLISVISGGNH
jgi:sulfur carrier protein ThiS